MKAPLVVDIESKWRVNIRGHGSWELCKQAGGRRPAWSSATRSWVVSEQTAKDVVAMAEAAGMNIVVNGPRLTAAATAEVVLPSAGEQEAGLW